MKTTYMRSSLLALLAIAMVFTSCIGDLDVDPIDPSVTQEFDQDAVFAKIYATLALTGQAGPDGNGDLDGIDEGMSAFFRLIFSANEFPTDEVLCSWGDPGIPELNFIGWSASNGPLTGLYARLNFDVTLCNHFLESAKGDDPKTLLQRAEVRFMRALNLYYLLDLYGNVPFIETVSSTPPSQISRADLFDYIEKEIKDVLPSLSAPREAPYGRADRAAAQLLLARLYLNAEVYSGKVRWAEAAQAAQEVLESGYNLTPVYAHLFMADNDGSVVNQAPQEILLPVRQHGVDTRSWGGSLFLIAATHTEGMTSWGTTEGWGGVRARAALVKKFFPSGDVPQGDEAAVVQAAGDDRALFFSEGRTVEINAVNVFKEGLSIAKFSNIRADGQAANDPLYTDTDLPIMRLAEAYLIHAEAAFRSGDIQTALTDINRLRSRAHARPLASLNLDDILDERARELYGEGHRRTDLIRFGYFTSNDYLWDWKGGQSQGSAVSSFYNLYPIPTADLNANAQLTQNPGY